MSRKIGDEFEDLIEQVLNIKKTPNSGAMFDDGDFNSNGCIFELKVKNDKKNFHTSNKELEKLKKQAKKRFKDWVYIQKTEGGIQVLVDLELFRNLWNNWTKPSGN